MISEVLAERLELKERIKATFLTLYSQKPLMIKPGDCQDMILDSLQLRHDVWLRRLITETMDEIGYRHVKIEGYHYYKSKSCKRKAFKDFKRAEK